MLRKPKSKARSHKTGTAPFNWLRSRTAWLELLFLLSVAVFGFSIVSTFLSRGGITIQLVGFGINANDPESSTLKLFESPSSRPLPLPSLSKIYTPAVQYWREHLLAWGAEANLDPNLVATVMQIESCGDPTVSSGAGAMGLFQVMPFHFDETEQPFDPDTNAQRGGAYLARGFELSGGHAGLALAGYNGGLSIIAQPYEDWPYETQRYYRWGSGIYREASAGWDSSPTLAAWLGAGGQSLCDAAETYFKDQGIDIYAATPTP